MVLSGFPLGFNVLDLSCARDLLSCVCRNYFPSLAWLESTRSNIELTLKAIRDKVKWAKGEILIRLRRPP